MADWRTQILQDTSEPGVPDWTESTSTDESDIDQTDWRELAPPEYSPPAQPIKTEPALPVVSAQDHSDWRNLAPNQTIETSKLDWNEPNLPAASVPDQSDWRELAPPEPEVPVQPESNAPASPQASTPDQSDWRELAPPILPEPIKPVTKAPEQYGAPKPSLPGSKELRKPETGEPFKRKMTAPMKLQAFEGVKHQIGYCGIWCGSCVLGNRSLQMLTQHYRKLLIDYDLQDSGPPDLNFSEFLKALGSVESLPACPGCRRGGGREDCPLRACAAEKGLGFCSQCQESGTCANAELLRQMRTGALRAGMFVESDLEDPEQRLEQWINELKKVWPGWILFNQQK